VSVLLTGRVLPIRDRLVKRPVISSAVLLPSGMFARLRDFKVWLTYVDKEGVMQEKTIPLDPMRWDVRVVSYRRSVPDKGEEITTLSVEDIIDPSLADDWKELVVNLRKWPTDEGYSLLVHIFYVWHHPPTNKCKMWYRDELIYDSETDGWRKEYVNLPW